MKRIALLPLPFHKLIIQAWYFTEATKVIAPALWSLHWCHWNAPVEMSPTGALALSKTNHTGPILHGGNEGDCPCPVFIALVPLKCPSRNVFIGCPFNQEKMPRCPFLSKTNHDRSFYFTEATEARKAIASMPRGLCLGALPYRGKNASVPLPFQKQNNIQACNGPLSFYAHRSLSLSFLYQLKESEWSLVRTLSKMSIPWNPTMSKHYLSNCEIETARRFIFGLYPN